MRLFQVVKQQGKTSALKKKGSTAQAEDLTHYQWSQAEEEAFIELHRKYGNKWALLARKFKGK